LTIFSYVDTLVADQCWCTFYWCDSWFIEWPSRAWPQTLLICLPSIMWPLPLLMRLLSNMQLLFFVHAPTFKHLLSSTSSFKHWTSPFKEILMALRQTKKTRHRNSYTIIPLQTLKTLKLILSSYCETMHVWKKHGMQLGIAPKLVHFRIFDGALCFPWTHGTHPSFFWTLRITLFTGHGIKGKTLCYIFVDSSFVYVWVCKYIFAYLNFFLKIAF
jgi:hypothetical protein